MTLMKDQKDFIRNRNEVEDIYWFNDLYKQNEWIYYCRTIEQNLFSWGQVIVTLLQETNNYHHYIYTAFDNKQDIAGT